MLQPMSKQNEMEYSQDACQVHNGNESKDTTFFAGLCITLVDIAFPLFQIIGRFSFSRYIVFYFLL